MKIVMNCGLLVVRFFWFVWVFVLLIIVFVCVVCVFDVIVFVFNVVCVGRLENEGVFIMDCFIRIGVYDIVLDGICCVCDYLLYVDICVMFFFVDVIEIFCEWVWFFDSKFIRDLVSNGGGCCLWEGFSFWGFVVDFVVVVVVFFFVL